MYLISPAYAQTAGGGAMGVVTQILPLILIFAVFYFLLIRPQQQRQKETRTMLAGLKRGDRIVTSGGILGVIQKVRDTEVEVEIAPNVRVTVVRETINNVVKPTAANDPKPVDTKPPPAKAS